MVKPGNKPDYITEEVLNDLRELGDKKYKAGLQRFGIKDETALGIKLPVLKQYAKQIGKDHELALILWPTEVHEARLLSAFIAEKERVTEELMEMWVKDFDSWDICDQVCGCLFDRTPYAYHKAVEWAKREEEFVKRAGFVLMAELAVHDKKAGDECFMPFFRYMFEEADDNRNFVKKAVNWALRQIGKRNFNLNRIAIETAEAIKERGSKSARWIAADALRELTADAVQKRIVKAEKSRKLKAGSVRFRTGDVRF